MRYLNVTFSYLRQKRTRYCSNSHQLGLGYANPANYDPCYIRWRHYHRLARHHTSDAYLVSYTNAVGGALCANRCAALITINDTYYDFWRISKFQLHKELIGLVSDNVNKPHRILYSTRILLKIHGRRLFMLIVIDVYANFDSVLPQRPWKRQDFICCCHPCFYINLHAVCELTCSNDFGDKQEVLKLMVGIRGPRCTIYRVTWYLRLLALSILTIARIWASYLYSFQKIPKVWKNCSWGHRPPQPPLRKHFLHGGSEFLFVATYPSDLTFLALLTSNI